MVHKIPNLSHIQNIWMLMSPLKASPLRVELKLSEKKIAAFADITWRQEKFQENRRTFSPTNILWYVSGTEQKLIKTFRASIWVPIQLLGSSTFEQLVSSKISIIHKTIGHYTSLYHVITEFWQLDQCTYCQLRFFN